MLFTTSRDDFISLALLLNLSEVKEESILAVSSL